MNLLFLLLSVVSGILVIKHPLFITLSISVLLINYHDKRLFILLLGGVIFGFILMLVPFLLSKIPFTKGYGLITNSGKNYYILLTIQGKFYVEAQGHTFAIGDVIYVQGYKQDLLFKTLEGDFNYATYLKDRGIFYSLRITSENLALNSVLRLLKGLDVTSINYPNHLQGLQNLLLTKSLNYDDAFLNDMARLNLLFIISLTGAHLSVIRRTINWFLKIFISDSKAIFFSYIALLPLFIFHITKFAFYRIFMTGIMRLVNKRKWGSYFSYLELNALVALLFLLINPYFVFTPAFYLAYLLIFGFMLLKPKPGLKGLFSRLFVLYVVLIPYQILNNGILNFGQLLLPLVLTPLISLWYLAYFMTFFIPFLQNGAVTLLNGVFHIATFFNKSVFMVYFDDFSSVFRLFFIGLLVLFIISYQAKTRPLTIGSALILIYSLLLSFVPLKHQFMASIAFINVGQGDAMLLNIYGQSMLVDTGGLYHTDVAREVLIPFLKKKRVYTLDYLVITHDDFDHSGGKDSLISSYNVKKVLTEHNDFPLNVKGVTIYNLNRGGLDENDDSLILYVELPCLNLLLMGDASVRKEEEIIRDYPSIAVDVIKIGHHGSNTSTSEAFIAHFKPQKAVISVGHKNKYGHPHSSVLSTLSKYNVEILRTDIDGTIYLNSCII